MTQPNLQPDARPNSRIITRDDLMSLERYAEQRDTFRQQVMAHKKNRQIALGPNTTLYFEDRLTLLYQIQEMLRIEKVFEAEGINDELEAYNPMIPDGCNFKATFMIEYADAIVRAAQLEKMVRIEDLLWMQIAEHDKIWSIADEDLERSTENKTSAVHFLRSGLYLRSCDRWRNPGIAPRGPRLSRAIRSARDAGSTLHKERVNQL